MEIIPNLIEFSKATLPFISAELTQKKDQFTRIGPKSIRVQWNHIGIFEIKESLQGENLISGSPTPINVWEA